MTTNGADLARLRRINELAVLATVRAGGELRLAQIAERTGLARASVAEVVRGLVGNGWLTRRRLSSRAAVARRTGTGSAPTPAECWASTSARTTCAFSWPISTAPCTPRSGIGPAAVSATKQATSGDQRDRDCLRQGEVSPDRVWATVAGSTGWVDGDGQVLLSASIPDWAGVDLAGKLRRSSSTGRSWSTTTAWLAACRAAPRRGCRCRRPGAAAGGTSYRTRARDRRPPASRLRLRCRRPVHAPGAEVGVGDRVSPALQGLAGRWADRRRRRRCARRRCQGHAEVLVAVRRYVRELGVAQRLRRRR